MKVPALFLLILMQVAHAEDSLALKVPRESTSTSITATISNPTSESLVLWDSFWTLERKEGDSWQLCRLMGLSRDIPPIVAFRLAPGESRSFEYRLYQFHIPEMSGTYRIIEAVFATEPESLTLDYLKTAKVVVSNEFILRKEKKTEQGAPLNRELATGSR